LKNFTFILVLFFLFSISGEINANSIDREIQHFINKNKSETLDEVTSFFNQFGSAGSLIIPVLGYSYGAVNKDEYIKKTSQKAIYASVIAVSIVFPLKYVVARERPDKSDNLSFPSGHTALSTAIFVTYGKNSKGIKKYLFYSIPFMVGFSRIYKNHHYFTDVVGGGLVGYLSVILAEKFDNFYKKRLKAYPFCNLYDKNAGLKINYIF
jgi:membrane-associated phospholipid phosphatase